MEPFRMLQKPPACLPLSCYITIMQLYLDIKRNQLSINILLLDRLITLKLNFIFLFSVKDSGYPHIHQLFICIIFLLLLITKKYRFFLVTMQIMLHINWMFSTQLSLFPHVFNNLFRLHVLQNTIPKRHILPYWSELWQP